jgi:ERF superfamily
MTTEIVKDPHHPFPEETPDLTPMALIQMAVTQNADIGRLEKLMELQLRWEANEARKAYVVAMNAFKENPPEITKNKLVSYSTSKGQVSYKHATLDHVCDAIMQEMSKHGLSHRWSVDQKDGRIKVTCTVTHIGGHSEQTYLEGGPDDSGGKNAIQAIASTVSYLQRYTLMAAVGLASGEMDNDGQGAAAWNKLQEFLDAMQTAPNLNVLETTFKAAFKEAASIGNTQAMQTLVKAKDARKETILNEQAT